MPADLAAALAAIDAANEADPNLLDGRPRALVEGRAASDWVHRLSGDPAAEVIIATRAHHLRRWELPRDSYPQGRAGYLRWRRDQKQRHGDQVATILDDHGFDQTRIERVRALLARRDLGQDPETQLVEDAACLVFLELRYEEMLERLEHAHMVDVVRKTLAKMSPAAIAATDGLELSDGGRCVLAAACT